MGAAATLVIKVKYGDTLRRFKASVVDNELDFDMDGLVEKVISLFKFTPKTDLILTYVDEDGDKVTLVDDDDLRDAAVKQALNPLRITVKLNTEKKINKPHPGPNPANPGALPGGFSHFSGSVSGPNLSYQNSISGSPVQNIPPGSQTDSCRRSGSRKDSGIISHHGVRCDSCGVIPITGPRFESKVKTDYDLCSLCFEQMGIDNVYIRMDRPAFRNRRPFRGWDDIRGRNGIPHLPEIDENFYSTPDGILDGRFVRDVSITDGTVMAPLTRFTKIWRLRNGGTAVWPQGTLLVFHYGDKMSSTSSVEVEIPAGGLAVDQEVEVAVDFISPEFPGRYIFHWRMASPSGQQFRQRHQRIWVLIEVIASIQQLPRAGLRGWNPKLLPPPNRLLTGPKIMNVNLEPAVEFNTPLPEPDSSDKKVKIMTGRR